MPVRTQSATRCHNSHSISPTVAPCRYSIAARAVATETHPLAKTLRLWKTRVHITTALFTIVVQQSHDAHNAALSATLLIHQHIQKCWM